MRQTGCAAGHQGLKSLARQERPYGTTGLAHDAIGHLGKSPETCYRARSARTRLPVDESRAMGRNFENRKKAIFKTAGQKSKLYSKYGKLLYVVAKNGVPDPEANPG